VRFVRGPFGHVQVNAIGAVQHGGHDVVRFGVGRYGAAVHRAQVPAVHDGRFPGLFKCKTKKKK